MACCAIAKAVSRTRAPLRRFNAPDHFDGPDPFDGLDLTPSAWSPEPLTRSDHVDRSDPLDQRR